MKGVTGKTERPAVAEIRPKALENKVSRAFKHCVTGKFLAESGKCHRCDIRMKSFSIS